MVLYGWSRVINSVSPNLGGQAQMNKSTTAWNYLPV